MSMSMEFGRKCKKCGKEFWTLIGEETEDYCKDCQPSLTEKEKKSQEFEEDIQ